MKKNLKKVLAAGLAASMVVGMSVPAFAVTTTTADNPNGVKVENEKNETIYVLDEKSITVRKNYKVTNVGTISPAETFSFTELKCTKVTDGGVIDGVVVNEKTAPVPSISNVKYNAGAAGKINLDAENIEALGDNYDASNYMTQDITIDLPDYKAVGVYTYTFSEIDNNTAGVTYHDDEITLVVTVIENNGKIRVAAVHTEANGENKKGEFDNEYSAGSLAITKEVTGNLGDVEKFFDVTVTFEAPYSIDTEGNRKYEVVKSDIYYSGGTLDEDAENIWLPGGWTGIKETKIQIKDDMTYNFTNIPYGVTYTVVEDDYTKEDKGGYDTAKYGFEISNIVVPESGVITGAPTFVVNKAEHSMLITNNKGTVVDTGISLDSMPYLMTLALSAMGALGFVSKKRKEEDEI